MASGHKPETALPHAKTRTRRQGPFCINKVISPVVYQLALPLSWGIHDVFHSSLLLPYKETTTHGPNFTWPPPDLIEGEEEYEVGAVINHRNHRCQYQLQYLIKWKDYPSSDNMWEVAADIHAEDLMKEYHQCHPLESPKSKASQGMRKLAHTLQLFTTSPSPTQEATSWLLHNCMHPTRYSLRSLPMPRSSRDKPSTFTAPPRPMSTPLNINTLSNTPASAMMPTANITPALEAWVNCPVKCPTPPTSQLRTTSSPMEPTP